MMMKHHKMKNKIENNSSFDSHCFSQECIVYETEHNKNDTFLETILIRMYFVNKSASCRYFTYLFLFPY